MCLSADPLPSRLRAPKVGSACEAPRECGPATLAVGTHVSTPWALLPCPHPSTNHLVKYLSHARPDQAHLGAPEPSWTIRAGGAGEGGFAHRLAFVFLLLSRLVCLGGCFSPDTGRRRYKSAPERFCTGPDASSVPDTAWSSDNPVVGPDPFHVKEATCPPPSSGLQQCWEQRLGLLCWFHEPGHKTGPEGENGAWGAWLSPSGGSWSAPRLGPLGAWVCLSASHSSRALEARPHGTEEGAPPGRNLPQSGLWEHSPTDLTGEWTPSPVGGIRPLFLSPLGLEPLRAWTRSGDRL